MTAHGQVLEFDHHPVEELATESFDADSMSDVIDLRDPMHRLRQLVTAPLQVLRECDGAVSAIGTLGDTECVLFATDPRRKVGRWVSSCAAIVDAYNTALQLDIPVVGVWQSGGARLPEGRA